MAEIGSLSCGRIKVHPDRHRKEKKPDLASWSGEVPVKSQKSLYAVLEWSGEGFGRNPGRGYPETIQRWGTKQRAVNVELSRQPWPREVTDGGAIRGIIWVGSMSAPTGVVNWREGNIRRMRQIASRMRGIYLRKGHRRLGRRNNAQLEKMELQSLEEASHASESEIDLADPGRREQGQTKGGPMGAQQIEDRFDGLAELQSFTMDFCAFLVNSEPLQA
ncbi:hypothetical protein B0H13DRAFT_1862272 [Mycena leptocephala]|nr:hypothetical protein B0H13DRAFT_1862272 [Mycena leptocephala]